MTTAKATIVELLEISARVHEDALENVRAELRRATVIDRAAADLYGTNDYDVTSEGLDTFAEDLADEVGSLCSEEAAVFAEEWLQTEAASREIAREAKRAAVWAEA